MYLKTINPQSLILWGLYFTLRYGIINASKTAMDFV